MSERRFFTRTELVNVDEGILLLPEDESHHASKVLRLKPGDPVTVIDGKNVFEGRIETPDRKQTSIRIISLREAQKLRPRIVLYQAFVKGKKSEFIVEKTTEAGVNEIIFFPTEYAVSRYDESKADRLQKIAVQAAKQSGREDIPLVRISSDFTIPAIDKDTSAIALHPNAEIPFSAEMLNNNAKKVYLFIGPEGGFSERELTQVKSAGVQVFKLNTPVLRTETAAFAAVLLASFVFRR